jgi:hypothetical protein
MKMYTYTHNGISEEITAVRAANILYFEFKEAIHFDNLFLSLLDFDEGDVIERSDFTIRLTQ